MCVRMSRFAGVGVAGFLQIAIGFLFPACWLVASRTTPVTHWPFCVFAQVYIESCLFEANSAAFGGSPFFYQHELDRLLDVTFAGNAAPYGVDARFALSSSLGRRLVFCPIGSLQVCVCSKSAFAPGLPLLQLFLCPVVRAAPPARWRRCG